MPRSPRRRVALVTGANRGIGKEIARQLVARGMVVLAGTRTGQTTTPAAGVVGAEAAAIALRLDVTRPETIHAAVDFALDRFGAIDVLVNNAGVSDGPQDPLTIDFAVSEQVWDINVTGAWRTANAVIPIMRDTGYGRIVNVSSTLGSLHHMTKSTTP